MTAVRDKSTGKFTAVQPSTGIAAAGALAQDTDPIVTAIGVPWTAIGPTDSLIGYELATEWAERPLAVVPDPDPEVPMFECPVDRQLYYSSETYCTVSQVDGESSDHERTRVVPVVSP